MKRRDCPGCRLLRKRVAELEAQLRELQQLLGRHAANSSLPPSANPPQAPKPVVKQPTGQPPGARLGHAPQPRLRLPAEQVQRVVPYVPTTCRRCHGALPAQPGPRDPAPTWHQVAELPPCAAEITEYQGHSRHCPHCGTLNHAAIPAGVRAHSLGPRLAATVAYLSGGRHDSKRGVAEVLEAVFGVPRALGTISAVEAEAAAALAEPHAEAGRAVQAAPCKHADETGWKQAGRRCWLWAAVTDAVAYFLLHSGRGAAGLEALLGRRIEGIVVSDRYSAYHRLEVYRRQLCWAHLLRDFQALVDRGGKARELGEELLCFAQDVFHDWYRVRDGTLARSSLRTIIDGQRPWLRDLLQSGVALPCAKTAAFCAHLLELEPALWTFVRHEGVEPTNNAAERALRPAVLWRRRSFGCHGAGGLRFVERMLTVVQTLGLQGRRVLDYLADAIAAHRQGLPAPKLLPAC